MIMYALSFLLAAASAAAVKRDSFCSAQDATEFALTYGEPLLSFEKTFRGRLGKVGLNEMLTTTTLSTPEQTATVRPNFDTLYLSQTYDLSRKDVTIIVPKIEPDRFYSLAFYTPYGDNYLNFGALDAAKSGTYLLTPATLSQTIGSLEIPHTPEYQGVIYSPNTIGIVIIRILLKNTGPDLERVREIQRGFGSSTLARDVPPIGPELNTDLFMNSSTSQAEHILTLAGRFTKTVLPGPKNDPLIPSFTTTSLMFAGIDEQGLYEKPSCVEIDSAHASTAALIKSYMRDYTQNLTSGWVMAFPDEIGSYGTNYRARASVARWGYLAMQNNVALYPMFEEPFFLGSNESYILRFSGKPPVDPRLGFWSVTLYNEAGLLVKNDLNRYAVGDRSNLTFPDGGLLYGSDTDGPFEILIQASQPSSVSTSNWLPSPHTPGNFELLLRFYAPSKSLSNGSYVYPEVVKGPRVD